MHEVKEQAEEKPARPGYAPIKAEFIVDADSKDSNAKNQKSNCAVNQKSNCDEEKETNLIDSQKHQIVKVYTYTHQIVKADQPVPKSTLNEIYLDEFH